VTERIASASAELAAFDFIALVPFSVFVFGVQATAVAPAAPAAAIAFNDSRRVIQLIGEPSI
jgi:hypothetical protein